MLLVSLNNYSNNRFEPQWKEKKTSSKRSKSLIHAFNCNYIPMIVMGLRSSDCRCCLLRETFCSYVRTSSLATFVDSPFKEGTYVFLILFLTRNLNGDFFSRFLRSICTKIMPSRWFMSYWENVSNVSGIFFV